MWYKSIPEILNWLESKSNIPWLLIDTETTGLKEHSDKDISKYQAERIKSIRLK
jgi:hypothetical protein